ncbi:hypothetical protein N7492_001040 [Penicillium capsulatum]|uniref:Xylanolytic transcriptional activator regulatory domain-containing protein n=1 Tax=Penicillium capsulatum TaxID=69766 RepID=A0A9W9ISY5_9EURO|nr:hypothetical protein N7492_001040 [Penicillium capsulatum]KAJ6129900.1 hypothetical protein N7512_002680 [Penicillium capsulatum]
MRRIDCELIESKRGKYVRRSVNSSRGRSGSRRSQNARDVSFGRRKGSSLVQNNEDRSSGAPLTESRDHLPAQRAQSDQLQSTLPETSSPSTSYYVIELSYRHERGLTEPLKIHHPIPASIAERPGLDSVGLLEAPLSLQEALTLPPRDIVDQLICTFFTKIHPAYPVLDRERFTTSYLSGHVSILVLQTIILLGFTIGTDELIRAAGFNDRATARKTHYLRAKALYDADYETDRLSLAAVLLLLGFWWAGPEDQKDTCYWVACAVTHAQSLGLHLSYVRTCTLVEYWLTTTQRVTDTLQSADEVFAKTDMTRDRHTAAAFGRPCRIRDEDCDVEFLTHEDFTCDLGYDENFIPAQQDYHVFYAIEMTKLANILGDILVGEYSPRRSPLKKYETASLANKLVEWESGLPNRLQMRASDGLKNASFWGCMLQISYQNCIILLYRSKAIENLSSAEMERDLQAQAAADTITRLSEDLLSTGMIDSGLIHLVPALFSALSIHTIVICRSNPVHRQLAENKSRQCMLALSVIAKSWPVRIWISRAFVNLMKRLTGQSPNLSSPIVNVSSSILTPSHNMAPPGQMGLPGLQNAGIADVEGQFPAGNFDLSSYCTCGVGPQPGGLHDCSCLRKAPDQFVHDSLWAGYLDSAFDVDLFLHSGVGPPSYLPFESESPVGAGTC